MSVNNLPGCPKGTLAYGYVIVSSIDGSKVFSKTNGLVVPGALTVAPVVQMTTSDGDTSWFTSQAGDWDGSGGQALPAGAYRLTFRESGILPVSPGSDNRIAYDDCREFDGTIWLAAASGGSTGGGGPGGVTNIEVEQSEIEGV